MASATRGTARPRAVNHCPHCGTPIPGPWQGRKAVTVCVVIILLVAGFFVGRLIALRDGQWAEEQRRRQQEQTRLRQEQQQLEGARQQLAAEQQKLAEERQQMATESQKLAEERQQLAAEQQVRPRQEQSDVARGKSTTGPTWTNSIGMEFVRISAGEFLMGSESGDDDEKPVHKVHISKAFYLGKYEVTQAQWQAVMGKNPSRFKGETSPVEQVSWGDAQEFIKRLNAQEGGTKYRLPTEAEWEYAARAGTTTAYSFEGDAHQLKAYAWFNENSENTTHPVGQKKPNPWGLYDMHGNAWEWVQDWYSKNAYKAPTSTAVDPQGPSAGSYRVLRGGSWYGVAGYCRSADRTRVSPGYRYGYLGFRLLREVP